MSLMRVISEAQFLAGEDARGALVVLEPETALSSEHLDALLDCGAAGFISDFTPERFEKPDVVPELAYDRGRYAGLRAYAVTPRTGVRLRTYASGNPVCRVDVGEDGSLSLVPPAAPAKRDKSGDPQVDKAAILASLRELGVKEGDTLMVHSSLSACGHIVGGAKTVIDALVEAVGEDGNFFFPSFQRSECFLNGTISRRWDHRPADVSRRDSASVLWLDTARVHAPLSGCAARTADFAFVDRLGEARLRNAFPAEVGRSPVRREVAPNAGEEARRQDTSLRKHDSAHVVHPLP